MINNILKKIEKANKVDVQLEKHEIELAGMNEIKEAISTLKNIEPSSEKVANDFEKKINDARTAYQNLLKQRNSLYTWANNEAPARINDFANAAKQLGLEINSVAEVKQLQALITNAKELVKALDGYKEPTAFK
jgi:hypothetical protein